MKPIARQSITLALWRPDQKNIRTPVSVRKLLGVSVTCQNLLAVGLLFIAAPSFSVGFEHCGGHYKLEMNSCMARALVRVERHLNLSRKDVEEEIIDTPTAQPESRPTRRQKEVIKALTLAHKQWVVFRNAECSAAEVTSERIQGSRFVYYQCMINRTLQRTTELKHWRQWKRKSMLEHGTAMRNALAEAERKIDEIYAEYFRRFAANFYENPSYLVQSMQSAKQEWHRFRRTDCEVPYRDNLDGDSGYLFEDHSIALQCLVARTKQRVLELEAWDSWDRE